ncbi:MAG: hypothetical protein IPK82_01755 [Polyangiaceae bacterium]|nr:hypothetical protein [Polyangiaceae bacterium]
MRSKHPKKTEFSKLKPTHCAKLAAIQCEIRRPRSLRTGNFFLDHPWEVWFPSDRVAIEAHRRR